MRNTVLAHLRLSYGEEASGSPERQERMIRAWCDKHAPGMQVEVYADVEGHHSGRKEEGRPQWQKLKARSHDPDAAVVIVESISRLFRNLKLLLVFVDECTARGVRFVSVAEGFDFKPPSESDNPLEEAMRRMSLQQFGALAEAWSNLTAAKMQDKVKTKRARGQHWGTVPFGAQRNARDLLEPDTAGVWHRATLAEVAWHPGKEPPAGEGWQWRGYHDALRRCYELYATDQYGWGAVADVLNQEGYRYQDRSGQPRAWNHDDVRRCLDMHLTYAGHLIRGRSQGARGPQIARADAWPPLLSLALIEQAVRVLQGRRGNRSNWAKRHHYPLTPLLYCATCGTRMVGQGERWGATSYRHYRKGNCPATVGQIAAHVAEREATRLLTGLCLPPNSWPLIEETLTELVREDALGKEGAARLHSLRAERAKLQELFREQRVRGVEVLSWDEFEAEMARYQREIARLERRGKWAADMQQVRAGMAQLAHLGALIEKAGPQTQKHLFASFFERLDIELETGRITYLPQEWSRPFLNVVIQCARRAPSSAITTQPGELVYALLGLQEAA